MFDAEWWRQHFIVVVGCGSWGLLFAILMFDAFIHPILNDPPKR